MSNGDRPVWEDDFVRSLEGKTMDKPLSQNIFLPGPKPRTVRCPDGRILPVPEDWALLEPGDGALTRRTKLAGEHWVVQEAKGRKIFSRGVWASKDLIARLRLERTEEQSTAAYTKQKVVAKSRREKVQNAYVEDFYGAVVAYLAFHPNHGQLVELFARAVTNHATPVGSGTVARTKTIALEQRAEAAVIAWMRHQTTGYDNMFISRTQGERREVRRLLAKRSKELLAKYRDGLPVEEGCPLHQAVTNN